MDDLFDQGFRFNRQVVLPEVELERLQPPGQKLRGLRQADPQAPSEPVHTHGFRKIDEPCSLAVDEDVERVQIAMDEPGVGERIDARQYGPEERFGRLEADVVEAGCRGLVPNVSHRQEILHPPRRRRHGSSALPGLAHHLELVGGKPGHRVDLDRSTAAVRGPVESIRLHRERRAVVPAQVDVRFLACADQAPDLGREARVEDGLRGPAVSGLTQVDRPMIDAPLDARVQGRVIRHLGIVGLFGLDRTAGHMCRDEITRSPARIGKLVGTSSPGTSWSYGPLGAIDPGGMNLWGRISRTVTLKPHRAIGWDGASAVVEITLVGEGQAQVGHEFVYRGPQPECRPCKVRAACLNQALGQRYRIKRVRDVTHPCLLNEERARVVEVELAPPEASLPSRAAIEGPSYRTRRSYARTRPARTSGSAIRSGSSRACGSVCKASARSSIARSVIRLSPRRSPTAIEGFE